MKITANGLDIQHTIEGEGPVVTMSHALGCNLEQLEAFNHVLLGFLNKATGKRGPT